VERTGGYPYPRVILGWRRRHVPFLVAGLAASLILSIDTPVTEFFFHHVPGFSLFRNPRRMLFLTTMSLASGLSL